MRVRPYTAVVFDLLTALLDSWTLWNDVAGSPALGHAWRGAYLELTYRAGAYRPYEGIIAEAAAVAGVPAAQAPALIARWHELRPWPEVAEVLGALRSRVRLGVATNASIVLGQGAVAAVGEPFDAVATAEEAGSYKPRPETYRLALARLGVAPEDALFVAGSAADVPGAMAAGMDVFWHNRRGLAAVDPSVRPRYEAGSLRPLLDIA